jgi:[ribosomal protein S5]-alanine N-acetyltransferase
MSAAIHLSSERLSYQPITTAYNTAEYLSWLNDNDVVQYLEIFEAYTSEQLEQYLLRAAHDDQLLFWAVHLRENGKHIGNIKVDPVNRRHGYGEYGIMMGDRSAWGKGYAFEASQTIIDFCFRNLGLRKIILGVVEDNIPAVNLYRKLGFIVEGNFRDHGVYNGQPRNLLRMALFNPDLKK